MPVSNFIKQAIDKIKNNERIDYSLAESLLQNATLAELGKIADFARLQRVGDKVYFISNYHLYYTDICIWKCRFCAFSRSSGKADAYSKSIDDIAAELDFISPGISEIRVTGGINPDLTLSYYEELLSVIHNKLPHVHIEAFAPTEIAYIAEVSRLSPEKLLIRLREHGLGSLTSGGAEIFNTDLRKKLCPRKSSIDTWTSVTKTAHALGIASNASILFGHFESYSDWLFHLYTLRDIQDETIGFNSFVPLSLLSANTKLDYLKPVDFSCVLRMMAISRIVLDNFKYIKFLWLYYGSGAERIKRVLSYGVNDLAGTANEKHKGVARSAGSASSSYIDKKELVGLIKECMRIPIERDKLYHEKYVYQ